MDRIRNMSSSKSDSDVFFCLFYERGSWVPVYVGGFQSFTAGELNHYLWFLKRIRLIWKHSEAVLGRKHQQVVNCGKATSHSLYHSVSMVLCIIMRGSFHLSFVFCLYFVKYFLSTSIPLTQKTLINTSGHVFNCSYLNRGLLDEEMFQNLGTNLTFLCRWNLDDVISQTHVFTKAVTDVIDCAICIYVGVGSQPVHWEVLAQVHLTKFVQILFVILFRCIHIYFLMI